MAGLFGKILKRVAPNRFSGPRSMFSLTLEGLEGKDAISEAALRMALEHAKVNEQAARRCIGACMHQLGLSELVITKKTLVELDLRSTLAVTPQINGDLQLRLLPPKGKP